eukprot:TRINITY_DN6551_c0_g1_i1.p1 TRINITY_DN6551_c0_g1~~TRINITY_DN6551_c0_g1_i1.p1  ORF type:complete len:350 (+),score=68.23 TRINITY_DN6551_c0_g1_i1:65-1114(+)
MNWLQCRWFAFGLLWIALILVLYHSAVSDAPLPRIEKIDCTAVTPRRCPPSRCNSTRASVSSAGSSDSLPPARNGSSLAIFPVKTAVPLGNNFQTWIEDFHSVVGRTVVEHTVFFTVLRLDSDERCRQVEQWRKSLNVHRTVVPLIFCHDARTRDLLQNNLAGPSVLFVSSYSVYLDRGEMTPADWKWIYGEQIVLSGYNAFYMDTSLVVHKDPLVYFDTAPLADFYVMSEMTDMAAFETYLARPRRSRQLNPALNMSCSSEYRYCASSAMWFARANIVSLRMLADVVGLKDTEPGLPEAQAMNSLLQYNVEMGLRLEVLQPSFIANAAQLHALKAYQVTSANLTISWQ